MKNKIFSSLKRIFSNSQGNDSNNTKNSTSSTNETNNTFSSGENIIYSPFTGNAIPLKEVNDGVFSEGLLGIGMAVEPTSGKLTSPVTGKVEMVFDTKHAYALSTDSGLEVLIHVGIDTVSLEGKPFNVKVKAGDTVKAGDILAEVDLEQIKKAGLKTVTPIIISNVTDENALADTTTGNVQNSDKLFKVNK